MMTEQERRSSVAFGSNVPRLMFPLHSAPTRLGMEQGIRGLPSCGPGTYNAKLPCLMDKPHSLKGWYFGCRTGEARSRLDTKGHVPGPPEYQRLSYIAHESNLKPFGATSPRFVPCQYHTISPGPGRYGHYTPKKIAFEYSFGGKRKLKDVVVMKCNNGIFEICSKCNKEHSGDYYEHRTKSQTLCPTCYKDQQRRLNLTKYYKVRDCRTIHEHQFPGFAPKIILKTESECKKSQYNEAYMRVYHSD